MVIDFLTSDLGLAALTAVLGGLAYLGRRFVLARVKWQRGHGALSRLGEHARRAVLATHNEYVEAIKAAKEDGQLTEAERAEAKRLAVARLKTYCEFEDLAWILGLDGAEQAANDAVEHALVEAKALGLIESVREVAA